VKAAASSALKLTPNEDGVLHLKTYKPQTCVPCIIYDTIDQLMHVFIKMNLFGGILI